GHHEVAAGRDPLALLETMAAMTGKGGMIPEQVWDAEPIPRRFLFPGRPTGSATPLAWAHAEFVKLVVSRRAGRPIDMPTAVAQRYRGQRRPARRSFWMPQAPIASFAAGTRVVVVLAQPALVRWGIDGWHQPRDVATIACGLGLHMADLPVDRLPPDGTIDFTWKWRDSGTWAGRNVRLRARARDR
ncbi:MAG: hypothetical protein ACREFY_07175, partial [Acetobacteraceae bacterium]